PRQGIVGYILAREHWGQGLGTELARGLVDRFFADETAHRVTASCDARNIASVRVLEKVPMRLEGKLHKGVWSKGEWVDECIFALLREEWQARKLAARGL